MVLLKVLLVISRVGHKSCSKFYFFSPLLDQFMPAQLESVMIGRHVTPYTVYLSHGSITVSATKRHHPRSVRSLKSLSITLFTQPNGGSHSVLRLLPGGRRKQTAMFENILEELKSYRVGCRCLNPTSPFWSGARTLRLTYPEVLHDNRRSAALPFVHVRRFIALKVLLLMINLKAIVLWHAQL